MILSCFQGVSVRGVFPIGTLGRYPRLRPRRFRLEHRVGFSERSAHSHTGLPLLTSTALDRAHGTIPEAVQTLARQQETFQGTDSRGSVTAPGTRWNLRCGGSDSCRRATVSALERKVSTYMILCRTTPCNMIVTTDASAELPDSIFRVDWISGLRVPPKLLHASTKLHGMTSQKTKLFVCKVVRTSNVTLYIRICYYVPHSVRHVHVFSNY